MTGYEGSCRLLIILILSLFVAMDLAASQMESGQATVASVVAERINQTASSRGGARATEIPARRSEVLEARSLYPTPTAVPSPTATPEPPTPVPSPTLKPPLKEVGLFRVTGYSNSPLNGTNGMGITKSGARTHWGVVAVDPTVIPLHSRLVIEGMGDEVFTALDTGGGVKGNWVDVWYPTDWDAMQHGVKHGRVYLVTR